MEKRDDFISRAMVGNLGERVKDAIMAQPPSRDDIKVIVDAAIGFGGLSNEQIVKLYGPAPFR